MVRQEKNWIVKICGKKDEDPKGADLCLCRGQNVGVFQCFVWGDVQVKNPLLGRNDRVGNATLSMWFCMQIFAPEPYKAK